MLDLKKLRIALWLSSLFVLSGLGAASQVPSDVCHNVLLKRAWERDAVRPDAIKLGHLLRQRGFFIECIRSSKEQRRFEGEKGAAWFKTDRGAFDVLFLANGQDFSSLKIVELPERGGRYLYSFRGTPHMSSNDSSKRIWFIKYGNALFSVWDNEQLAAALRRALQPS